ncbi:MAG: hypothetical protein OQK57_05175 [Ignavibacteriaceae bacterium]|nr:hypothetical protein [Ignavibacteriaceae bacterium]
MKHISAILLVTLVLLAPGCDTNPDFSVNNSENNLQASLSKITDYELIPLPNKSLLWVDSVFTISEVVDGSVGGRVIMEKYYISEDGDSLLIKADLRIPEGAFQ